MTITAVRFDLTSIGDDGLDATLGKRTKLYIPGVARQEELASYPKDREAEGVRSVHFYFPNDLVDRI
jgi:hypothetical protein